MIVVWGLPRDPPTWRVYSALRLRGADVRLLDQRATIEADAEMSLDARLTLTVRTVDGELELARCTAAYVRPYDWRELATRRGATPGSPAWERAFTVDRMLVDWADLVQAVVVNRPSAMASNSSKPFQARQLREAGFCVPDTLVTTDPDAVCAFRDKHRRVVYKSISGIRSIVSELTDRHRARLGAVRWCPTQFRELVPGTEYRVHVVGEDTFATEIESDALDYRYAHRQGLSVGMRAARLPDEVIERCVAVTRAMGLTFGGIDLKRTPDGRWYCFELNPSPGFTYYQDATGQPIDEAVARLLDRGVYVLGSGALGGSRAAAVPLPAERRVAVG
jgi:RimK-like ATP-grasp domain